MRIDVTILQDGATMTIPVPLELVEVDPNRGMGREEHYVGECDDPEFEVAVWIYPENTVSHVELPKNTNGFSIVDHEVVFEDEDDQY